MRHKKYHVPCMAHVNRSSSCNVLYFWSFHKVWHFEYTRVSREKELRWNWTVLLFCCESSLITRNLAVYFVQHFAMWNTLTTAYLATLSADLCCYSINRLLNSNAVQPSANNPFLGDACIYHVFCQRIAHDHGVWATGHTNGSAKNWIAIVCGESSLYLSILTLLRDLGTSCLMQINVTLLCYKLYQFP